MTQQFKAIIFDMDGLLVDSEIIWQEVEEEMLGVRGWAYTEDVREQLVGLRLDAFMAKWCEFYPFKENAQVLVEELINRMLEKIPVRVQPQPGAAEIVAYVKSHDIPTAIASSSPMSIIDSTVSSMGWDDVFTMRFSADDDAHGKPAPDVYLRAAKMLGFKPADCLALEDSPTGSKAAVAAGMVCYSVPDPSHARIEAFKGITPHIFKDLHEVLASLKA